MNGANSIVAASIRKEMKNQPLIQNTTVEAFPDTIPICEETLRLIQSLPPEQHEKEFQKLEAARIRGEIEVPAGLGGRCDIVASRVAPVHEVLKELN